jgi:hypothetical protein
MSSTPKHRSRAMSRTLLLLLLATPLVGLATCMVQTSRGASTRDAAPATAAAVTLCLLVSYVIIRVVRWRKTKGPSSLIPR